MQTSLLNFEFRTHTDNFPLFLLFESMSNKLVLQTWVQFITWFGLIYAAKRPSDTNTRTHARAHLWPKRFHSIKYLSCTQDHKNVSDCMRAECHKVSLIFILTIARRKQRNCFLSLGDWFSATYAHWVRYVECIRATFDEAKYSRNHWEIPFGFPHAYVAHANISPLSFVIKFHWWFGFIPVFFFRPSSFGYFDHWSTESYSF